MKYIRTNDGIIDLANIKIGGSDGWKSKDEYIAFKQEDQIEKIKQADTIEELCDEFVVFGEHVIPSHSHFLSLTDIGIKSCLEAKATIYGAIWTDKGLIYVAKMNDKGEFELL